MKFNIYYVVIIIHRSSTISSKTRGTDKSKSKDEELNREDLALVDKIFDTLEFDEEGKVDIEKVSLPDHLNHLNIFNFSSIFFS